MTGSCDREYPGVLRKNKKGTGRWLRLVHSLGFKIKLQSIHKEGRVAQVSTHVGFKLKIKNQTKRRTGRWLGLVHRLLKIKLTTKQDEGRVGSSG